jgi:hypothetical protein
VTSATHGGIGFYCGIGIGVGMGFDTDLDSDTEPDGGTGVFLTPIPPIPLSRPKSPPQNTSDAPKYGPDWV